MSRAVWLLLLLFLASCLDLGCGGMDSQPTQTSAVPSKSDLGTLPKRERR